jgi:hypothetical protein
MMKLEQFKSLSEKQYYFQSGNCKIDNLSDFYFIIDKLRNDKEGEFIYRGVNEAKYMMYNSAQRYYIENESCNKQETYKEFILSLIFQCKKWKNGAIVDLFRKIGVGDKNYLSYLSALQHSGNPSPCLDFTLNPLIAIFFAFNNSKIQYGTEIDYYVSLYQISTAAKWYFIKFGDLIIEGLRKRNQMKNKNIELSVNNEVPFNILFSLKEPVILELTENIDFRMINTLNIIFQEGKLIFNSSPDKPIEVLSKKRISKINADYVEIKCLNFNKNLKNDVLNYLNSLGYNYDSLFKRK